MDTASLVLFFTAVFMLLVMVSLPIIGSIYILRWIASSAKRAYRGVRK